MAAATSFQALTIASAGVLKLSSHALPALSPFEILIKTSAVALNPTDWKHRDFISPVGAGLGCDFAGTVERIGDGVKGLVRGDRVAGFVHGGRKAGVGAFAEYVKTEGTLVWKVPENVDDEEAAAMGGVGPHTAFQALYLRHGLPQPSAPITDGTPFLVWGGATSVGMYTTQLAKLSGYTVIATSSPKNFALCKSFGADQVYSYSDPATPAAIRAAYPTLAKALDTISEKGTTALAAAAIGAKEGGGKIVTLLGVAKELQGGIEGVVVEPTLAYTLLGKGFEMRGTEFPASPSDKKAIEEWLLYVHSLIAAGKLRSNPLWRQEGGLAKLDEGLNLIKEGKNSGQKITYKL